MEYDETSVRDALFGMEPQVKFLEGLIAILRLLGEAQDSVEPAALEFLGHFGGVAVSELDDHVRCAVATLNNNVQAT